MKTRAFVSTALPHNKRTRFPNKEKLRTLTLWQTWSAWRLWCPWSHCKGTENALEDFCNFSPPTSGPEMLPERPQIRGPVPNQQHNWWTSWTHEKTRGQCSPYQTLGGRWAWRSRPRIHQRSTPLDTRSNWKVSKPTPKVVLLEEKYPHYWFSKVENNLNWAATMTMHSYSFDILCQF